MVLAGPLGEFGRPGDITSWHSYMCTVELHLE